MNQTVSRLAPVPTGGAGLFVRLAIACLIAACLAAGCVSMGQPGSLDLTLIDARTVELEGHRLAVNDLTSRLRRMGVSSETEVEVTIPPSLPTRDLGPVTSALGKAGCRKVFFVRAQKPGVNLPIAIP
ncbi:MAG: hypothetical protein A2498_13305 [Lentisphaerae bacterium RIFOXYC12_FULL_60_16]|nr:MAG: hypothetical protein A2498_13305 [Lentisphaerae bacterium RIFOXYC12_FULL_60_16]